jgi:hypothetical protein
MSRLAKFLGRWRPSSSDPSAAGRPRAVDIGWVLDTDKASFIWDAPARVRRTAGTSAHAKSVDYCPAIHDYEARLFEVPCPIDLRLRFRRDDKGAPQLVNAAGDAATIRSKHLNQMLALVSEREWRHPQRPIIQIITPYVFVADEPVYMTQMAPVTHYRPRPWPGVLIGGRLPIHIWPRQMMWAFEWWDTAEELVLKRGEPWFQLRFETVDPSRPVRMFEAEMTPALREHIQGLSSVSNYVNRTFSLFKTAQARRPEVLLQRKRKDDPGEIA